MSILLSFGFLHLEHLLFCCNAGLLLVYNSVLSQLCHYHESLWKAESHFYFWHVGSKSHVISVCKNFTLFFNPKMLQHSSFVECERNFSGNLFVGVHCAVALYAFSEQFFNQCCWCEKVVDNDNSPRTKTGFHMSIINFFPWMTFLLPTVMPVYTCNFKPCAVSVSHKSIFSNYTNMACFLCKLKMASSPVGS